MTKETISKPKKLLKQALEAHGYPSGRSNSDLATCLGVLAGVYENLERFDEAENWCRESIKMHLDLMHPDRDILRTSVGNLANYAANLNILASILNSKGDNDKALEHCSESLRILDLIEEANRQIHPFKLDVLENIGIILFDKELYKEAESLHRQVLGLRRERLVAEHPDIAFSFNNLASCLEKQGKDDEAEKLYLEALDFKKKSLSEEHPSVGITLKNLARFYTERQKYDESIPYYIGALASVSRKERLDIATILFTLATFHYEPQKQYSQAKLLYEHVLQIRQQELGSNHDDVAACFNNLATVHKHLENYDDAQDCYVQAYNILCQVEDDESKTNAAITLNNLAGLYGEAAELFDQKELYAAAENCYSRAFQILLAHLGAKDSRTLQVWRSFRAFLNSVIEKGETAHLSDDPATQNLLRQLQEENGE